MTVAPRWPETLWIVRHGESAGNIARSYAEQQGLLRVETKGRDVDVPLSDLGRRQSAALGAWFARGAAGARPDAILCSPYLRARQTAELFLAAGGASALVRIGLDERLREKEFGILDGLTPLGVKAKHPEQYELRAVLGKFYHRPPGGESWVDVIFRLRSLLDTVCLHYASRRVLIVAHEVVVFCLRYIIEGLTEEDLLAIDRQGDIANCAITEYAAAEGVLRLVRANVTAPLDHLAMPVTDAPDPIVGARG